MFRKIKARGKAKDKGQRDKGAKAQRDNRQGKIKARHIGTKGKG